MAVREGWEVQVTAPALRPEHVHLAYQDHVTRALELSVELVVTS